MADLDIDGPRGVVDKRRGRGMTGASVLTSTANQDTISAMKTRLNTINATSYSAARMATMTENDLMYAIRLADDAAGI